MHVLLTQYLFISDWRRLQVSSNIHVDVLSSIYCHLGAQPTWRHALARCRRYRSAWGLRWCNPTNDLYSNLLTNSCRTSLQAIVVGAGCHHSWYFTNGIVVVGLALIVQSCLAEIRKVSVEFEFSVAVSAGWSKCWTDVQILMAVLFISRSFRRLNRRLIFRNHATRPYMQLLIITLVLDWLRTRAAHVNVDQRLIHWEPLSRQTLLIRMIKMSWRLRFEAHDVACRRLRIWLEQLASAFFIVF